MSAPDAGTVNPRELVERFVEAFNDRDPETLRDLVAEDAELRTLDGSALRGHDGLRTLLQTAEERNLRLVALRSPTVQSANGAIGVKLPVRELIGPDDIERTAEFEVRDGRIVEFAVRPYE